MPIIKKKPDLVLNYEFDDFTDPWENRPYLLLQHGNGRSSKFWYRWIPYLVQHYRIIRPDIRGLGKSKGNWDTNTDFTLEAIIDDIISVLDDAKATTIHFCGESMGGILGLVLAAKFPDRIRSLTLVAAPVFIEQKMKDRYALGYSSRIEAMQKLGIKEWVAATTKITRLPADEEPGLYQWYVEEFAKEDPEVQIAMSRLVNKANAKDFLSQINVPVLGLYPTAGQITSDKQVDLLHEGLKDFNIVHLPTNYHMVHLLYPELCTNALKQFLSKHS